MRGSFGRLIVGSSRKAPHDRVEQTTQDLRLILVERRPELFLAAAIGVVDGGQVERSLLAIRARASLAERRAPGPSIRSFGRSCRPRFSASALALLNNGGWTETRLNRLTNQSGVSAYA